MASHFSIPHARVIAASAGRWAHAGARRARARYVAVRTSAATGFADPAIRRKWLVTGSAWTLAALAVVIFVWLFQWDWLRGPIGGYASMKTGRQVRIAGHLQVHPFSLHPTATVGGLTIGNPRWAGPGNMADMGQTTVRVRLLPLFVGRLELNQVRIEHPTVVLVREAGGRNNWTFGAPSRQPAALPPIEQFILKDGKLTIDDGQRHVRFDGVLSTREETTGAAGAFHLDGAGRLNRTPFSLRVTGGPLLHVRRDRPYPFDAEVRAGASRIAAKGTVTRPFDLGRLNAALDVSGADLADLYDLTGVVFPNTPPYRLTADFSRQGGMYVLKRLGGRVGDSDLRGELSVDKTGARPFLRADLASRRLDFDDLNALLGGPPGAGRGQTASPAQQAMAARMQAQKRLLPDATLDVARVRTMDADVSYRAETIRSPALPLRQASVHLTLDHGLLRLDPLAFTFPRGQAAGWVRIDARPDVPVTDLDMRVSNVRLEDLLPKMDGAAPVEGLIQGRARLHGVGNSVHKAAAGSSGQVAVAVPGGQMRKSLAELMGVNVVPGIFELLAKNTEPTPLRCAVANFQVSNGRMLVRQMVLDTGVARADGQGSIDLGTEALDLGVKGKSKKPRLVRVIAPVDIRGHLAAPVIKVQAGAAVAQAGVGVALGVLASPLAAILPFLSLGGGHDADCIALMGDARSAGAPVKAAQAAPSARH